MSTIFSSHLAVTNSGGSRISRKGTTDYQRSCFSKCSCLKERIGSPNLRPLGALVVPNLDPPMIQIMKLHVYIASNAAPRVTILSFSHSQNPLPQYAGSEPQERNPGSATDLVTSAMGYNQGVLLDLASVV